MSGRCFLPQKECKFVIEMIDSLKKLLKYNLPSYDGILASFVYRSSAGKQNKATLDIEGYIKFTYYIKYKETYPSNKKTQEQINRINAIWVELGMPDKQISS